MKYPFNPELLDALPEKLAELFRGLEDTLLSEICSRLNISGQLNEVTVQDIRALRAHGISIDDIEKAIKSISNISQKKLNDVLQEVVDRNQQYYKELINFAGVTQPEFIVSSTDIDVIMRQTQQEMSNITRSMGFLVDGGRTKLKPAQAYQWALDSAELKIQSGAIPYTQAIRDCVRQLADSGIKTVEYESGHIDHVDVAVRRAVMTGVSQLCARYTEQTAEYLNTPYFEVSAHAGARDKPGPAPWSSHKDWQGKVYSKYSGDIYPNIYTVCGLGYVDGLEGANCRHIRRVWVEGVTERTYTDEELANIDKPPFEYEGKEYTTFEATQKQRQIERTIRKYNRRKTAFKAAGDKDEATIMNIRLRRLKAKYKSFSEAAELPMQQERMRVQYD